MRVPRAALALLLAAAAPPRLYADLSQPSVEVSTGFKGADVLVYGAVQYPRGRVPYESPRIAVVARGPDTPVIVRAKARVAGIWVNARALRLGTVPGFAAVLTSRPVPELLDPTTAALWEVGLDNLALAPAPGGDAAPFIGGLFETKRRQGLYREDAGAVTVTDNILYRARLLIPSAAPLGRYSVTVHLIEDGAVVATVTRVLEVRKAGFEARVSAFADERPFLYGLSAVAMALTTGWAASWIGRRR